MGGGARDAATAVAALAERLAAPVITTYGAAGVLPPGHPSAVGLPPHTPAAGALWDEADVVLAIGSDLDGVQTQNFAQPQPDTLIAVSLEPIVNYRADIHVAGEAGEVTAALAERVRPRDGLDALAERLSDVRAEACGALDATALRFLDSIHFAVPADGVLVLDMCIPGYWLAGFHTPAAPRRLQVPLGWGTLGYAFPAALGAALAGTGGPVVSISGDGGFLFACGELATMAQEQIPLTAVIVDDGGYGMLRYDQQKAGARDLRRRPPHPRLRRPRRRLRHPRRNRRRPRRRLRRSPRPPHVRPAPVRPGRPHPDPARPAAQHVPELVPPPRLAARGGSPCPPAARRGPSGPSGACRRSPSSSTASG